MPIYFDANRGNDSNDGSTPALAKATLATLGLGTARAAGFEFFLADDSEWTYATRMIPTNWGGTEANPIIIGKYSPSSQSIGQRPVIKYHTIIAAEDWTYDETNNGWYYDHAYNIGPKCLVRLAGTWAASQVTNTGGLPLDSVEGRYQQNAKRLHLYAPSGTNPTDYYGEVLLSTTAGFLTITSGRGWVQVQDLEFRDTCTGIYAFSDTASDVGVIARRIYGRTVSSVIRGETSGALGQLYLDIGYCDVRDWGSCAFAAVTPTDGSLRRLLVHHNDVHDGGHCYAQGAFHMQARSTGVIPRFVYNHLSGARYGTPDKTRDGAAIYMEIQSGDCEIAYNLVHDCYLAFQDNSGRSQNWHSNVVYNCWAAMKMTDESEADAGDITFKNNTCIVGDTRQTPAYGDGFTMSGFNAYKPIGSAIAVDIQNNAFTFMSGISARAAVQLPAAGYTGTINLNAAYGFLRDCEEGDGPYSAVSTSGWRNDDQQITAEGRPLPGSPLLTGGTGGIRRDIDGVQSVNFIGAHAPAALRSRS